MDWWKKEKKPDGTEEVVVPKEIQEQLDAAKGLKTTVDEMSTKLKGLDVVTSWINEQKAEAAKPKPRVETRRTPEEEQAENEELSALLLTNPREAHARLNARTNAGLKQVSAALVKREVFEDNAENFPYYTGAVKLEINKILAAQTLDFQNNPEALENTYYTVVGKMQKDISEGKIKDRFAGSGHSSRVNATDQSSDGKVKLDINDDIRKIAKQLGYTEAEYMAMLNENAEAYI